MSDANDESVETLPPTTTSAAMVNGPEEGAGLSDGPSVLPNKNSLADVECSLLYDVLHELCQNNIEFFAKDDSMNGSKLHAAFLTLGLHIAFAKKKVGEIRSFCHEYDFDEHTKGNGYRSFVIVVDCCIKHSIKLCRNVLENRSSLLFRKSVFFKEIESCSHLLSSLIVCLDHLLTLRSWSSSGSLFTEQGHTAEELLSHGGSINQYCFYGRCLGFQFAKSIRGVLKFIASTMAGFSEGYYSDRGKLSKTTSAMWTSGKFLLDPELRARRIVNLSQNSDVYFCKAFWLLSESELMAKVPSIVGTTVKVNKVIKIPPERLQCLNRVTTEWVDIPIPSSHIGVAPIQARLLSATYRKGMMGDGGALKTGSSPPPATALLFHCHGGGFVAQSSKSHEIYLREWAVQLNIPILSIDYSLAPEAPYPRALEEVFYAYCWALQNCNLLGTTAEKVIFAGDSAGANLNLACALKCIDMGVRIPDGILLLYCPTMINFVVSPARMLCLMDPLLPFSFMMGCLRAYTCPAEEVEKKQKRVAQLLNIKSKNHHPFTSSTAGTAIDSKNRRPTMDAGRVEIAVGVEEGQECTEDEEATNTQESSGSIDLTTCNAGLLGERSSDWSDTMASATSLTSGNFTRSNTEAPTPDESSGLSFEEDSQPIQSSFPGMLISSVKDPFYNGSGGGGGGGVAGDNDMNLDDELPPNDPTAQYVSDFLDRYVIDATNGGVGDDEMHDGASIKLDCPAKPHLKSRSNSEENIVFDIGKEMLQNGAAVERLHSSGGGGVASAEMSANEKVRSHWDDLEARGPSEEFKCTTDVPHDPFVSPYYATDEVLRQLPPVKIITLEMDPCLDDCVMFAKRLKAIDNDVTLDILSGLPHGFLNFVSLSKDAMEGLKLCVKRMNELLK